MSRFLDDFETGEVLRADALQGLSDAVAGLSMKLGLVDVAAGGGGGVVEYDGGVAWPWQVMECELEGVLCLQVAAGEVLVGGDWQCLDAEGNVRGGWRYVRPAAAVLRVEGYDAEAGGVQVVWLVMRGEVRLRASGGEGFREQVMQVAELAGVELVAVAAAAGEVPAGGGVLRMWPLAVWDAGHEQRLTQLQWGELSAVECTGLVDEAGEVVWPQDRGKAAAWGTEAHAEGMARLCAVDFSTAGEDITGELRGCVDADGAAELYLGFTPAEFYEGGENGSDGSGMQPMPGDDEEEDDDGETGGGTGGGGGGGGGGDDEPVTPDMKVAVKIGYEAGDGFSECTLVRRGGGYYWKLVLDGEYVAAALMGVDVAGKVTFKANGTQEGKQATVEMGLGGVSVSASGGVSGSAALVFHGTNAVDASKKSESVKVEHVLDARMAVPKKVWYLSPRSSSTAGSWVKLTRSMGGSNFDVRATEWWTWSVDRERLRAAARTELQRALAGVSVNGAAVSVSEDSTVTGTLSGNALDMVASAILS